MNKPDNNSVLKELKRIAKYSQRGHPRKNSFWDTHNNDQEFQERYACDEFAKSLSAQGMGKICGIRKNDEDYPDCLAEMDGKVIGIEVTELEEYDKEWTLELFQEQVLKRVWEKNKNAQISGREELLDSLDQLYILILIDDPGLAPETIGRYMRQPLGSKPDKIDEAFVLVKCLPSDDPVIRGRELEPEEEKLECIHFQILWKEC